MCWFAVRTSAGEREVRNVSLLQRRSIKVQGTSNWSQTETHQIVSTGRGLLILLMNCPLNAGCSGSLGVKWSKLKLVHQATEEN